MLQKRTLFALFSCVFMFEVELCVGQHFNDTRRLRNDLLNNYDREIRPCLDHSKATVINMTVYLVTFKDFYEQTGTFSVVIVLVLEWFDHRMLWNPYDYGNLTSIPLLQGNLWTPYLVNAKQLSGFEELCSPSCTVRYHYDGKASWSPADVFDGSCEVNMEHFPFDKQTCELRFGAWGFQPKEIFINPTLNKVLFDLFTPNGIWNIEDTNISSTIYPGFQLVNVAITFSRKPAFFVVNIILPIMFIGFLNIAVFKLPTESGERVGYVITSLLSVTVYITSVSEMLPKTNQPNIAMFNYLLLTYLIMSSCIVLCTILTLSCYYKEHESVPLWINKCMKFISICFRKQSVDPMDSNNTQYQDCNKNEDDNVSNILQLNQEKQSKDTCNNKQSEITNTVNKETALTYYKLGEMLDNVFFVIYLLFYIIVNVVYFSNVIK